MKKQYQDVSNLFGLLAHTPRLRILDELRRGEACVCHLQAALDRPQTYVSQQLRVLREADVVSDRRDGLYVFYGLSDPRVERLLEQTLGLAGEAKPLPRCCCPHCDPESETSS
ncbi:MAG: metalloregulator ArsR/SmtB family transcription factor [Anaerolineae bacterium]|jgi:ArsR family transcriptional regulator